MAIQPEHLSHIRFFTKANRIEVRERQAGPRVRYEAEPGAAWVTDCARTVDTQIEATHPIHGHVVCGEGIPLDIPVSVHKAVGGESDFPCPGEILAAALASCLDTATRMIANLMAIELDHLEVRVSLGADVRGTLMMGSGVPVGFQNALVAVDLVAANEVPEARLHALMNAAERSCVLLQTLRNPPDVQIERNLGSK